MGDRDKMVILYHQVYHQVMSVSLNKNICKHFENILNISLYTVSQYNVIV